MYKYCWIFIFFIGITNHATVALTYNSDKAATYADEWCNDGPGAKGYNIGDPNPNNCDPFKNYSPFDCANFVSQCLKAGGIDLSSCQNVDNCGSMPSCYWLTRCILPSKSAFIVYPSKDFPWWMEKGDIIVFNQPPKPKQTVIRYSKIGNRNNIKLEIYDISGRLVEKEILRYRSE